MVQSVEASSNNLRWPLNAERETWRIQRWLAAEVGGRTATTKDREVLVLGMGFSMLGLMYSLKCLFRGPPFGKHLFAILARQNVKVIEKYGMWVLWLLFFVFWKYFEVGTVEK